MHYSVPSEIDFYGHDFDLSKDNDPNEGIYSYVKTYSDHSYLIFTHSPSCGNFIRVYYTHKEEELFHIHYRSEIQNIEFQKWNIEKIIRVSFKDSTDIKIFFENKARIEFEYED